MYTRRNTVLPAILIFLILSVPAYAQFTIETATPIEVGESGSGAFDEDHGVYFWEVELEYDGSLSAVVTQGEKSGQPYVIYDEPVTGGTWIDSPYVSYDALSAGTYYIAIMPGKFPSWEVGSYSITVRSTPNMTTADSEPNDDIADAVLTGAGVKNDGHLGYYKPGGNDTVDWWRVQIPGDGFFEVVVKAGSEGLSLNHPFLYSADGGLINSLEYETRTDGSLARNYAVAEGIYYIYASNYYGYGSYTVDSAFIPSALDNDHEPNDDLDTADILEVGISGSGHLGFTSDSRSGIDGPENITDVRDWWGVSLEQDGELTVTTQAEEGLEIWLYLYNEAGDLIKMGSREDWRSTASLPLSKGYYYILADRPWRGYGSYSIEAELVPPELAGDVEPNDTRDLAMEHSRVDIGRLGYYTGSVSSVNGPVNVYDSSDFWQITVDNDGPIEYVCTASEGLEVWLHLYDSKGSWLTLAANDGAVTTLARTVAAGTYFVQAELESGYGSYTLTDALAEPVAVDECENTDLPGAFKLHPASPNPFNPSTAIRYELPRETHVSLTVYDINGQKVAVLRDWPESAGFHEAIWNGYDMNGLKVGGGMYFYRLRAGDFTDTGKMLLIK